MASLGVCVQECGDEKDAAEISASKNNSDNDSEGSLFEFEKVQSHTCCRVPEYTWTTQIGSP